MGFDSHELRNPVESVLGSLNKKEGRYLEKLEQYNWAGRYNIPTNPHDIYDRDKLNNMRISYSDEEEILDSLFDRLIKCA